MHLRASSTTADILPHNHRSKERITPYRFRVTVGIDVFAGSQENAECEEMIIITPAIYVVIGKRLERHGRLHRTAAAGNKETDEEYNGQLTQHIRHCCHDI
jgi:hypothetical protein